MNRDNMQKLKIFLKNSYLLIWLLILVVFTITLKLTATKQKSLFYDEKVLATDKTLSAYQAIKKYRINNSINLADPTRNNEMLDTYATGLLGYWLTDITTTTGDLEAKRISINPSFAAVVIDMLVAAGIKKGDEVGVMASGSFPALTIAVLSALEIFEVKACIIASIGSSSYGANIPEFTIFDMIQVLIAEDILKHNLDYVSFGGFDDSGSEFPVQIKEAITSRIAEANISLLEGDTYQNVIKNRQNIYQDACPNMKLFINIGGHYAALGEGKATYLGANGLVLHTKRLYTEKRGLINRYLEEDIPVIHFLNIVSLAQKYDLSLNPQPLGSDYTQGIYYEESYSFTLILAPLLISLGFFFYIFKKSQLTIAIS